jgi:hypothetical protein
MKRVPPIIAVLTATVLTICFFQARGRGIGFVPPVTDWELHSAWWHFNALANCGVYLVVAPSLCILLLFHSITEHLAVGGTELAMGTIAWISIGLPVAIESLLAFYVARQLCQVFRRKA